MHQIQNNTTEDITHLVDIIEKFLPYSREKLGFHKPVMLSFQSDEENANRILGKTAFYNPADFSVTVFITGRHPKDVLRSLSHELVHHAQNCRGDFSENDNVGQGYAQKDPHMRNMELEAYEKGNIIFRDFEDLIKAGKINIKLTGEPKMTIQEWKNNELNKLLLEKWGYRKEDDKAEEDESANQRGNQKVSMEDEMDLEEGAADWKAIADAPEDPTDVPTATALQQKRTKERGEWGKKVRGKSGVTGKRDRPFPAGSKNVMTMGEGCPHDEDQEDLEEGELTEWAPGFEPPGSTHDFLGNPLKSAPKGTKAKSTRWYAGDSKPGEGDSGGSGYAHDDPESEEYHTDPALEKRREYQRWKIANGLAEDTEVDERMLTLKEARDVARRIFERIQKEL